MFMIDQKTYATFDETNHHPSLTGLCHDLLSEQKRTWEDLRNGYESLKDVKERKLDCKGFSVRLQHNPGRIKSSTAHVGEQDTNTRPCFLCLDRLPENQKGILYRREFLILCNPAPVFYSHFTLTHVEHRRQAIAGAVRCLSHPPRRFWSRLDSTLQRTQMRSLCAGPPPSSGHPGGAIARRE